ncbi:MAG: low specificity L-threonine aldolase [Rhodobacteraceae bacterium]|nr:low specificity L-threonine aldolase [Paracoccaceae bacterium]
MYFASDNAGPVHPQVMEFMTKSNTGYAMPYGDDTLMDQVRAQLREIFEAPDAAIYLVALGTAANSLALATLTQPWQTIFCSDVAHIHQDECNAPEFYTGGAKLTLVPGGNKMTANALRNTIEGEGNRGVHGPARGPVSITQVTERGSVYCLDELVALTDVAKSFELPVHMDGARFANALVTMNCTAADMTWRLGVDVLTFGGTKNGLMGVEAVIFFDPKHAWEFELRRKRAAHLFSKHRYLSAQMVPYLTDDLWLTSARQANANSARLANGLKAAGVEFTHHPDANMIYTKFLRSTHARLRNAGAAYEFDASLMGNPDEMLPCRLVCDWSISHERIDQFLSYFNT